MKPSILTNRLKNIVVLIIWILIWQGIHTYVGKDILIPSPFKTLEALSKMIITKEFHINVLVTIYRVCIGVMISFGLGLMTAIIAYFSSFFRDFLKPLMIVLKSTPVMAIIILVLLWVKSSNVPIFACFLMCYPVAYTNILTGLENVDKQLIEMGKIYKVKSIYMIKDIYIPHVTSYIKSALSLIVGLSWKVVVAAEVLAVPKYSMGYNLFNAKVYLETEELFAWVIVIVILSSLFEKGVNHLMFKKRGRKYDTSRGTL